MRRAEFVFCIGYDGNTAIVDGGLQRKHGGRTPVELAEAGLYKQALAAARYDGDASAGDAILAHFNARAAHPVASVAELERLYGTTAAPEGVSRVTAI